MYVILSPIFLVKLFVLPWFIWLKMTYEPRTMKTKIHIIIWFVGDCVIIISFVPFPTSYTTCSEKVLENKFLQLNIILKLFCKRFELCTLKLQSRAFITKQVTKCMFGKTKKMSLCLVAYKPVWLKKTCLVTIIFIRAYSLFSWAYSDFW